MNTVNTIGAMEIFFERGISYFYPNITEKRTLDFLFLFEFAKVYFNIKRLVNDHKRLIKTKEEEEEKAFNIKYKKLDFKDIQSLLVNEDEILGKIKESVEQLEKTRSVVLEKNNSLSKYSEKMLSSGKRIYYPNYVKLIPKEYRNMKTLNIIAELVFILRPLVYCYLLKYFGSSSLKPYLINLIIDCLWIVLHFINFKNKMFFKREIKNRLAAMLVNYMLRNPFFDNILKKHFLEKIINFLVKNQKIKDFLLNLVAVRTSLSYVI